MNWKKTLIRNLLFAVLVMAAGSYCTGCCWTMTEKTWDRLGSEKATITNRHYEYSPDRSEIIFSCKKKTKHYVWPFLTAFDVSWNTYKPFEKRIPLEPVPENLIRVHFEAVPDPAALRAHKFLREWMPGENQFDNPVEIIRDGTVLSATRLPFVQPGDTLRMHVHPDDLPVLSGPCVIRLEPVYNAILLFPYAQDGSRYEMLTRDDVFANSLHVFADEFEDEAKRDNEDSIGTLGYCWKYFWLPSAAVTDILIMTPCSWVIKGAAAVYLFGGLVAHGDEL
jgi:hypothetical protein